MPTAVSSDNLTRAEAQTRAALVSDIAYDIALRLSDDPAAATFESVTTVTFTAAQPERTFIDLVAESVSSIELNGAPLDISLFSGTRIDIPSPVGGENRLTIVAACHYQHTGVGLHRAVDPVDNEVYVYTHFEPFDAHKVFACFDQPDLKARVTMHVTAPQDWTIISNYPHNSNDAAADGLRNWNFDTTPQISTYLVAIVGGAYHGVHTDHNGITLGIFCRRSLAEHLDADEIFTITKQGLDFFAEYFDCPYPFAKYDQLMVPEFNMGAMENPGCITFNEMYVFRSKVTEVVRMRRSNTILHEMAHMWFGDLVTMRWWDDLWLNESFATYMAHLAIEKATRFDSAWVDFAVAMKSWALRQDQLPSTHPIAADMVDTESVRLNFDGITYAKGASVLRQLVAWVGDTAFRDGIRGYFKAHAWGNASLADFLAALEQSSGRQLRPWSHEWLETAGVGQLRPDFTVEDGSFTRFHVAQSASESHPMLRSHRVGVGIYDAAEGRLVRRQRIDIDVRGERTEVAELVGQAAGQMVVVNDGDLAFTKIRLDPASVRALVEAEGGIDDSLTRAVCGAALWDMTRDAEMATRDYVAMVSRHAHLETDVTMLERSLAQASSAIDLYGDPANREAARAQLSSAAWTAWSSVEPGSDVQLVWARVAIATSDAAADQDRLASWLDEKEVNGLKIDTDLRWQIVSRLAAAGRFGNAEIEAETELDPTDIGMRRAAGAQAARPVAENKARAWQTLMSADGTPLQILKAIMMGFAQPDQQELTKPYVAKYFEALAEIWTNRSSEEADNLTEGLYPLYNLSDDVIAGVDAALTDARLGVMPRRILSEARDGSLRARRARAVDKAAAR